MTILDLLLGHDIWTTRQLLLRCQELSEEQMSRPFAIGARNLRETLEHLIACMESHTDLMLGRTSYQSYRDDESVEGMLNRLMIVAKEFAAVATRVEREGTADEMCTNAENEWRGSFGSVIAHVVTHSMHHRAQIMYIMEQLGIQDVLERDALGWEGQARGWGYNWSGSSGRIVAS